GEAIPTAQPSSHKRGSGACGGGVTSDRVDRCGVSAFVLPAAPVTSIDEYVAAGGGRALQLAREKGGAWVLEQLAASALRGRGGAGFPTARKWESVANAGPELGDHYAVANGAEGEPGTFKDRPIIRANPYQVVEGLAIAATVVGAREAFVAVKASFAPE